MGKLFIKYNDDYGVELYTFELPDIEESLDKVAMLSDIAEAFKAQLDKIEKDEY